MVTYGTNPGMGIRITGTIPDPADIANVSERQTLAKALRDEQAVKDLVAYINTL